MMSFNNTSDVEHVNRSVYSGPDYDQIVKARYMLAALVLSWIYTVLILVLNSAVIVAIWKYNKRSRLYFLLLNMAVADLLTGMFDALPHSVERSMARYVGSMELVWSFGSISCKLQRSLANATCMASNYILAATSIDRALVVCRPMASFRRRGNALQKIIVALCWVGSAATSSWYIKEMGVYVPRGYPVCGMDMIYGPIRDPKDIQVYLNVYAISLFAIPFMCIVISYTFLVITVCKRAASPSESVRVNNESSTLSRVFNRGLPRTKRKSIKLTFGIIVGFLLAWSTFFGFLFRQVFGSGFKNIDIIFVISYYWNCIVNPVAFFIFHRRRARTASQRLFYSSETRSSEMTMSGGVLLNANHSG